MYPVITNTLTDAINQRVSSLFQSHCSIWACLTGCLTYLILILRQWTKLTSAVCYIVYAPQYTWDWNIINVKNTGHTSLYEKEHMQYLICNTMQQLHGIACILSQNLTETVMHAPLNE